MHVIFGTFVPELWPLIYAKISFPFNIWRTNGQNFTKFYICIHIDKIYIGIVTQHFSHICTRVMALDLRQNFVSDHYLENKLIEFHQILYSVYIDKIYIGIVTHHFSHICTSVMALDLRQNSFPFNILRTNGQNFTKFYAFILTRSALGLLHIIFCTFVPELWPLIYAKILFPFNILRTNGQNFTKFYICIHIDKIYLGIVLIIFRTFVPELWQLI